MEEEAMEVEPVEEQPRAEVTLDTLPEPALEKIFKNLTSEEKAPGRLRNTCKKFNTLYLDVEGRLPWRQRYCARLTIISQSIEPRLTLVYQRHRCSVRGRACRIENPRLTEVLKFLKVANWLKIIVNHKRSNIFGNAQIEGMVRSCLAQRAYFCFCEVFIKGFYPLATSNVINMFPRQARIVVSAMKGAMTNLSLEALRKVDELEFHDKSRRVTKRAMERILDNHLTLQRFTCEITGRPDIQKYVDEWKAGTRKIKCWRILYPKRGGLIAQQTHQHLIDTLEVKCYNYRKHYELTVIESCELTD